MAEIFYPPDLLVWTCERVQAWLDQIGLREYASRLNGSGVHGGLLGLHADLDANQLALILQIPTSAAQARAALQREMTGVVERFRASAPFAAASLGPAPRVLAMEAAAAARARYSSTDSDDNGAISPPAPVPNTSAVAKVSTPSSIVVVSYLLFFRFMKKCVASGFVDRQILIEVKYVM